MNVNLTDYVNRDCAENDWELRGWWCGWVDKERIFVIPLGDTSPHRRPKCRCVPRAEIVNGVGMIVHNAFDGRERFEPNGSVR